MNIDAYALHESTDGNPQRYPPEIIEACVLFCTGYSVNEIRALTRYDGLNRFFAYTKPLITEEGPDNQAGAIKHARARIEHLHRVLELADDVIEKGLLPKIKST